MSLHAAALPATVILQTPGGGVEGVVNRLTKILVWSSHFEILRRLRFAFKRGAGPQVGLVLDHHLSAGQRQVDSDMVLRAFSMVPVGKLNSHTATHDRPVEALKPYHFLLNPFPDER
jgi:hypothetical protein